MRVLEWTARATAPAPAAVVAAGQAAKRLLARLRAQPEAELEGLSAVATRSMLVIIGAPDTLPWVDGARYCAPDPLAPGLWLPTHAEPNLPADLLYVAAATRVAQQPLLLWHDPEQILSLERPASVTAALLDWLEREIE
jgi:hypothetical protein